MTLIWKQGFQLHGWVIMQNTSVTKDSHKLLIGLDARKTDGHQTHSVKVFSWEIFIYMWIFSYVWFLAFSTLLYRSVNILINIDLNPSTQGQTYCKDTANPIERNVTGKRLKYQALAVTESESVFLFLTFSFGGLAWRPSRPNIVSLHGSVWTSSNCNRKIIFPHSVSQTAICWCGPVFLSPSGRLRSQGSNR